jgi:hypothetical protein
MRCFVGRWRLGARVGLWVALGLTPMGPMAQMNQTTPEVNTPSPQSELASAPRPRALGARRGGVTSPIGLDARPHAPWRLALLPRQTKPVTDFSVVTLDDQRVLRISADRSYGKLLHPVEPDHATARMLSWQWRVDQFPVADLRQRGGDDVAVRVCAFFDWPQERLSMVDRARLATAELIAGESLPSAVMCYVWDPALPTGTIIPNAFTRRLRTVVVDGDGTSSGTWLEHRRNLQRDFQAAFWEEWRDGDTMPPLRAIVIGSDTDNTAGMSLSYLRDIRLEP